MGRVRIAVLALAALAVALPASAAAATWVVKGAGYGHGVGMGAYGAYGYGKHGFGYRQILHRYYTGIEITALPTSPQVRVLLAVVPGDVSFSGAAQACGRALDPTRTYAARRRTSSVRLLSGSGRLLAHCGGRLRAGGRRMVRVHGVGVYRGALEVVPTESGAGSLNAINRLDVESYVRGSVPGEVPPDWPTATLKAFAVAIRSIALSTDVGGNGFELYADTRTQVYGGVGMENELADAAVRATRGQVVTHRGEIAQTVYSSSTGGRTESGFLGAPEIPYLRSVPDPYDYYSPQHRWTFRFTQAEMESRLGGYVRGRLRAVRVTMRGDSPRIEYARLVGSRGNTTIRGDRLAAALGLYDRWAYFTRVR